MNESADAMAPFRWWFFCGLCEVVDSMNDETPRRGFQFGLLQLVAAMAVLSVLFAFLLAAPTLIANATAILMSSFGIAGLIATVVYGRGDVRAFAMGALATVVVFSFPAVVVVVVVAFEGFDELDDPSGMRWLPFVWMMVSPLTGRLSVAIRRRLTRDE
ncbi:MAG: hypothetical protein KDA63_15335 [Planctomycetales bacterium]|nr:hypothetical protein [Planctomycetales bacterium]